MLDTNPASGAITTHANSQKHLSMPRPMVQQTLVANQSAGESTSQVNDRESPFDDRIKTLEARVQQKIDNISKL